MGIARTAFQIYKRKGVETLIYNILNHLYWKLREIVGKIFSIYWDVKGGKQEFTINGVSAEFDAHTKKGGDTIRNQVRGEYDVICDLLENIEEDDVFYDIGANLGLHSKFAMQICQTVIAFEPYPPNYNQLVDNLEEGGNSCKLFQMALSDSDGEMEFSASEDTVGHGSGGLNNSGISVNVARGDSIISRKNLEQPDIVKIDVEGAEGLVVEGMKDNLSRCRRIYCEIHLPADHRESIESYGWEPFGLMDELSEMGFDIHILKTRGPEIQIIAEK